MSEENLNFENEQEVAAKDSGAFENMVYDPSRDTYICRNGKEFWKMQKSKPKLSAIVSRKKCLKEKPKN